jgi:hypothetical protein
MPELRGLLGEEGVAKYVFTTFEAQCSATVFEMPEEECNDLRRKFQMPKQSKGAQHWTTETKKAKRLI